MVTNRSVAAVWSVAGMSGVLPLQAVPTRKCCGVSLDPTQTQHGNEMLAKFKDTISSYSICRLPSGWLSHSHVSSLLLNMIPSVSVHTRLFPHDRAADRPAVHSLQHCNTSQQLIECRDQDINMLPTQSYSIPRLKKSPWPEMPAAKLQTRL